MAHEKIREAACYHFRAYSTGLSTLVKAPGFKLKAIKVAPLDGRQMIQVDFERPHALSKPPHDYVQSGTLILDPESYWCIAQATIQVGEPGVLIGTQTELNKYSRTPDGFPMLVHTTGRLAQPSRKGVADQTREAVYDLYTEPHVPDSECTLTKFDLPEPVNTAAANGPRTYIWLIGSAVACILLAMWFRYLGGKGQQRVPLA